ncbi:MAG: DUF721 domain-containing protein [Alphaproteobacteria bacterium]|nr:DUF721 domain-containing protein [Alphaproteobacteria bacterium]
MTYKILSDILSSSLKKIANHKGEDFGEIVSQWYKIVGPEIASRGLPLSLKYYKTTGNVQNVQLAIKAKNQNSKLELEFSAGAIIERINSYLGFKLISNIKVK